MKTNESNFILNVVATPIGNTKEVSLRLKECFLETEIFLCEDTRVTKKLVNILGINNHYEYYKFDSFSENIKTNEVIDLIKSKKKVTLVSDAGYPNISDPGYKLIHECINNKIAINIINGPCSIIHALVGSGFPTQPFLFLGFLGKTKVERTKKILKYKNFHLTIVIFEAVHRIISTLQNLYEALGNKKVCIARELTKLHEEFLYFELKDYNTLNFNCKGEFVIVINNTNEETNFDENKIENEISELIKQNLKTKEIANLISQKYSIGQNLIYKIILKLKNNMNKI
ncbi:16S rRNA (cytidine(1402)-2'-O)-methyltransferase [bacterium]|nr:16S rRNA (cytidine(1402)-2'-O)-methyltransferase [bacterium]